MSTIRFFVIVIGLFLIRIAKAQVIASKPDFYILADSPTVKHITVIKSVSDKEITIKEGGKKRSIRNGNLLAFRYEMRDFQAIENFYIKPANPDSRVSRAFVEVLDSGQVSLFSYHYTQATLIPILASGTILPGIGSSVQTLYLVRDVSTQQVTTIPADDLLTIGKGPAFRNVLQPFLLKRPDLLNTLQSKHFHIEDLADIIRALNSNKPFVRTNRTPFGVD